MITDWSVIEGEYLRDILDQPQALADTLTTLANSGLPKDLTARLRQGKFQRIVLTGMGSSFHALHPLNLGLVEHGFSAEMVETSELIHYKSRFFDPTTLIVAVSQSGQSAEMVRLVELNRRRAAVIAVTNTAQSPLSEHADYSILTQAGDEFSVSCKTYVTALMALNWLGEVLCGGDLARTREQLAGAADVAADYLASWKDHVEYLTRALNGIRHLFLVGRGSSLAAVGTGALIVKESDHFHAEGMSSAAFRHGPLEMLGPEMFVVVFGGEKKTLDLNVRLLADIVDQQGRAELVGEDASSTAFRLAKTNAALRSILEILPVEMITLALAAQSGREPGRFEVATKVTTTE